MSLLFLFSVSKNVFFLSALDRHTHRKDSERKDNTTEEAQTHKKSHQPCTHGHFVEPVQSVQPVHASVVDTSNCLVRAEV